MIRINLISTHRPLPPIPHSSPPYSISTTDNLSRVSVGACMALTPAYVLIFTCSCSSPSSLVRAGRKSGTRRCNDRRRGRRNPRLISSFLPPRKKRDHATIRKEGRFVDYHACAKPCPSIQSSVLVVVCIKNIKHKTVSILVSVLHMKRSFIIRVPSPL